MSFQTYCTSQGFETKTYTERNLWDFVGLTRSLWKKYSEIGEDLRRLGDSQAYTSERVWLGSCCPGHHHGTGCQLPMALEHFMKIQNPG